MARITKPVEERRQEIIDTARALFIENGFDKTQAADISKKMNVAAGLVYHYFKSKTEILYAVIDQLTDEKVEKNRQFLIETQGSALDRLKLLFATFGKGELHEETSGILVDDPAIMQYFSTKISNSFLPILADLIGQGNTDGSWSCEYPEDTAVFILQGMAGVMSAEQARKSSSQEKNKELKTFMDVIYRVLNAGAST